LLFVNSFDNNKDLNEEGEQLELEEEHGEVEVLLFLEEFIHTEADRRQNVPVHLNQKYHEQAAHPLVDLEVEKIRDRTNSDTKQAPLESILRPLIAGRLDQLAGLLLRTGSVSSLILC